MGTAPTREEAARRTAAVTEEVNFMTEDRSADDQRRPRKVSETPATDTLLRIQFRVEGGATIPLATLRKQTFASMGWFNQIIHGDAARDAFTAARGSLRCHRDSGIVIAPPPPWARRIAKKSQSSWLIVTPTAVIGYREMSLPSHHGIGH